MRPSSEESGNVLLIVLLLTFLFSALAIGTATAVGVEITMAARGREGTEALYVAEAGLALAIAGLRPLADWTPVLQGLVRSAASLGPFAGPAAVAGGGSILLCCGGTSVGGRLARESAVSGVPARRTLTWQPFLWSAWDALVTQPVRGQIFVVAVVQDDEEDGDADPATDLNGIVVVRSEALRPDGLRRVVEGLLTRVPGDPDHGVPPGVRLLAWREVR